MKIRECVLSELDIVQNVIGNSKSEPPFQHRRCFIAACGVDQYLRRLVASGSFAYSNTNTHSKLPTVGHVYNLNVDATTGNSFSFFVLIGQGFNSQKRGLVKGRRPQTRGNFHVWTWPYTERELPTCCDDLKGVPTRSTHQKGSQKIPLTILDLNGYLGLYRLKENASKSILLKEKIKRNIPLEV